MQATNETRADSAKSQPARTTNGREPTTRAARGASSGRRFGPNLGEMVVAALAVRLATGGHHGIVAP